MHYLTTLFNQDAAATFLNAHIRMHQTLGRDWPTDAVYAAVYDVSTWPMGWSQESHVSFFSSLEEFEAWKESYVEWAKLEDNVIRCQVYEWDLGPNRRVNLDFNL